MNFGGQSNKDLALGLIVIWVAWFAFNGGSAFGIVGSTGT
jgi:ammonia channel protein AmtB